MRHRKLNTRGPITVGLLLLMLVTGPVLAQNKVGTTAGQFLKIGMGARASSMGDAFVAVANDISSIYWNPAGTARMNSNQVQFGYSDWFMDIAYNHALAGFLIPQFGSVGIQVSSLSMGDMPVRTEQQQEGTGERFSAGDLMLGVNYARNLTDRFSLGFNFKYIQQSIWHMSASTFAIDVGTIFTTQFNGMRLGMSISNFGAKMQMSGRDLQVKHDIAPGIEGNNPNINAALETDKWSLPLLFRVGLAMDVLKNKFMTTTVAVDAIHPNDNSEYVNTGLEVSFLNNIYLRGGYKSLFNDRVTENATFGGGLRLTLFNASTLQVDYSYTSVKYLPSIQRFTVTLGM